jgi:hypothetical protein
MAAATTHADKATIRSRGQPLAAGTEWWEARWHEPVVFSITHLHPAANEYAAATIFFILIRKMRHPAGGSNPCDDASGQIVLVLASDARLAMARPRCRSFRQDSATRRSIAISSAVRNSPAAI